MKFPALLVVCFAAVFSEFIEAVRNQTDDHSYRTLFCYQSGLDDPKLARQLRFRMEYNAACAALLCAAGKVEEGADSPEAAKLRKQALEWLTTNLATWKRMMEKKPQARAAGMKQLRHWQTDADLANVRGPEINGLREEEREGWRELWAEVNRVLDAAAGWVSLARESLAKLPRWIRPTSVVLKSNSQKLDKLPRLGDSFHCRR